VEDGEGWQSGTTWHPVGQLCHEAAAELRRLHELHVLYQDKVQRLEFENFSWQTKLGVRGYENQLADMLDEIQRLRAELKFNSGAFAEGVMAERQRIVNLLMTQHEAAKDRHNYWHVAANLIQAEVASDT
jgi:hypothetical protein